jgi:branched-chain amino acid transport system substrate-binding protein
VTARVRLEAASLDSLAVGAGAVWVGSSKEGVVWRLDVGAGVVARTIEVGRGVNGLAVGDSGVWAVNGLRGTLTRIDADRNAVVETIHVGNTPRAAVVAAEGVWVAVQGSTGGALAAPTADATPGALPASSCGPVYHAGAWPPDALIVSDFPLQGGLRFSTGQMEEAIAFVLREREFRAGRFRVAYQSCDDSLASTGIYDVAKCASNAEAYAANELVLGVIGTVNSDCAVAAIPILNEATGGPLAMVSPLNSHPGLTRPGHGLSIAELYPTGKRTYARVYPSDDYQGAALALLAQELGARRVAVVGTRGEAYADLVARSFRRAAASLGLEIAVSTAFDPQAESYEQLADRVAAARPDAVFVAGLLDTNGARVVADLRAALGGTVPILVPDGFTPLPLFTEQAGEAAEGVYVSLLGLPALEQAGEVLTAKARRFIAEFGATQPSGVEPSALFAAEAANVLLDAIARSDGTRASVVDQLLAGETNDGFLGTFRFDENGDTTLNPVSIYRVTGRGGVTRILGVDGGTLDRVLTPPSRLVHE